MWCNQIFSQISENVIQNIIVCDNFEVANYLARCTYGESAFAVDTTLYPVHIGDTYDNGRFYRISEDETRIEILRNPSQEESIYSLQEENRYLAEIALEADARMTMLETESVKRIKTFNLLSDTPTYTYWLCLRVINNRIRTTTISTEWKNSMLSKLEVFKNGGRLKESEYTELTNMVNQI